MMQFDEIIELSLITILFFYFCVLGAARLPVHRWILITCASRCTVILARASSTVVASSNRLLKTSPSEGGFPGILSPLWHSEDTEKLQDEKATTCCLTLSSRWWYYYNQCRWKIKFSYTEHTYNTSRQFNVTVHAMPYSRKYYNIIFIINYYLFWFCVVSILFLFENHHRYGCEWCTLRTHHWHCTIYCYAVFTLFWFASHPSCFILLFQYNVLL